MTEELTGRALRPLARVIDDEETVRNSTVFYAACGRHRSCGLRKCLGIS